MIENINFSENCYIPIYKVKLYIYIHFKYFYIKLTIVSIKKREILNELIVENVSNIFFFKIKLKMRKTHKL